ncbi:ferredoxin [Geodermatophilus arenarius]|uniref:Ferredoxin n=1 Tax=Geodermatophilus arenarius TaxID=1137990 RepID=A0ABV9LK49_9ACTN
MGERGTAPPPARRRRRASGRSVPAAGRGGTPRECSVPEREEDPRAGPGCCQGHTARRSAGPGGRRAPSRATRGPRRRGTDRCPIRNVDRSPGATAAAARGAAARGRRRPRPPRRRTRTAGTARPSNGEPPVRISIDPSLCQGHGRCYDLAPDLFSADDEGYSPRARSAGRRRARGRSATRWSTPWRAGTSSTPPPTTRSTSRCGSSPTCSASRRRTARGSGSSSRTRSRASTCRPRSASSAAAPCSSTCSRRSRTTSSTRARTSPLTCSRSSCTAAGSSPRTSPGRWRCCSSPASTPPGARSAPRCGTSPATPTTGAGWSPSRAAAHRRRGVPPRLRPGHHGAWSRRT